MFEDIIDNLQDPELLLAEFKPDWVSPPGDTISDILEERGISKGEFCRLCNFSLTFTNFLLAGNVLIDAEIAQTLARVLGASKEFWLSREDTFRIDSERLGKKVWWEYDKHGKRRSKGLKWGDKMEFTKETNK